MPVLLTGWAGIQKDRKLVESSNQNGNQLVREVSEASSVNELRSGCVPVI